MKPAVLFLAGAGLTAAVALRSIAELDERFQVIAAPVRDEPVPSTGSLPAEATVESAIAWLDASGVEQAHVVGLSFGGTIAQQIAIRHPHRVRSLVLCATSAGGAMHVPPEAAIQDFVRRFDDLPVEEGLWASVPYLYTATTRREHAPRIGYDIERRLSGPLDPRAIQRQQLMARSHNASAGLNLIAAPTLVMHGEQDRLVPLENGRRLAHAIADADLIAVPGGGHAFPTDVPGSGQELLKFLLAHSRPRGTSAAARTLRAARA